MTVRFALGVSIAALLVSSGAMAAPATDDEAATKPVMTALADTTIQLAALTEDVTRAISATTITLPATEASTLTAPPRPSSAPVTPTGGLAAAALASAKLAPSNPLSAFTAADKRVKHALQLPQAAGAPREICIRAVGRAQTGTAAWYGGRYVGRRTSSGEPLDTVHSTAAHRTLPLNSLARVTNLHNGRSVIVRVTDRGPVSKSLLIDVSPRAADELGMKQAGLVPVMVEQVVEVPPGR
jgi:rare lipoprotein A (peptidoglycan hydrolase)